MTKASFGLRKARIQEFKACFEPSKNTIHNAQQGIYTAQRVKFYDPAYDN